MTSSNKARRYLQQHLKQHSSDSQHSPQSTTKYLIVDPTLSPTPPTTSSSRKFRSKTQQVSIPQICVNNNNNNNNNNNDDGDSDNNNDDMNDDNGHVAILNEFDKVLDNELKHTSVLRTSSLKQNETIEHIEIPINQQRSFSFALGSKTNLQGEKHSDNDDEHDHDNEIIPMKTRKLPVTSKSSLSKETFSRLFHSLTFRSGNHSTSKTSVKRTDSQPPQHPCLACQNYPYLNLIPKNKKRPSIFGVLVAKFNTSTLSSPSTSRENSFNRCTVCKRPLSKSISHNDDNQQLLLTKNLRDQKQLFLHIKRRQSLPSLLQNLLESSSSMIHQHRPSFSAVLNQNLIDHIHQEQTSVLSQSTISLTESDDSNERQRTSHDHATHLIEKSGNKDENDNEITIDNGDWNSMYSNDSTIENNSNQQFLHPPEEKTRSLLINVFRTRRSNAGLTSNETHMVGKQFSVSVLNLATAIGTTRRNSAIGTINDPTIEQRKHALSDENLPTIDNTYIHFTNINGKNFKEKLKYSTISEDTTLREMLIKLFEKHHLSIDRHHICLRSAPTLPLSLNQPVKHLLLDDLVVTETTNQIVLKTSAGKEKNEKRNSTGSAILSINSKSTSKRLSTNCMMLDNDDNHRTSKTNRLNENNLSFVRRKCDEWLIHGLPKLAQLQYPIDQCDLIIEKEWQRFLSEQTRASMSETMKLQQETIYEMLSTEVSYIRQILTMTDIFMRSISILKSSQRDGLFNDIDMEKLFSNIQDVIQGNLLFWKEILLPIKIKLEQSGLPMNPSDLKDGFLNFDTYFKPYLHYVLDQKTSAEYFKQKLARDEIFQYLIMWIEANFTNRLSFSDLTIKPLQRLTRYKLLLEAIQKKTTDIQQKTDLNEMIQKVATFVNRVNSKLHHQEQEERLRQINDRIGPYENVSAPPELSSILQEYNRDSISNRLDLLQDMPLYVQGYQRQIIQQGPMKMKDAKNSQDVYCYLFTDMFLITKGGKRCGSANSPLTPIQNDGQANRSTSNMLNKIVKPPIRIDRLEVREYDRRGGGNPEPNTASFVTLVFSEYNLIESGYLFQTNLSKQWIENIRRTKANFQLLMEESKLKFQSLLTCPNTSVTSTTNIIHHSLPSLSSPSLELPILKIDDSTENDRRSSKVESNVFKIVEQTRRNSRTDRKNFGRYFTADGTSTHDTNSSPSSSIPIKQISSSSTAILKRMSWNNEQTMEKNDTSLITNSFRSVHSSSGVSSTGSFLFSTDEDASITTTTTTSSSIPSIVPSTVMEKDEQNSISDNQQSSSDNQTIIEPSSPESSLRRTPYTSIRKRSQQKISHRPKHLNDNDLHSSTHTIVYESSKSIDDTSSLVGSGNESDYDNNQSPTVKSPVNQFLNSDELLLGDQNEIILHNNTNFEHLHHNNNPPSDNNNTNSSYKTNTITSRTLDDSAPTNSLAYQKDPLITRRLIDIRSHLLLNTTLDATEV